MKLSKNKEIQIQELKSPSECDSLTVPMSTSAFLESVLEPVTQMNADLSNANEILVLIHEMVLKY